MKLFFSRSEECFCAFCRSTRRIYSKRRLSAFNFLASGIGATAISFAIYRDFDPMTLIFFIGFLILSEIFMQVRWRVSMTCRHCGFDPVLYLKNQQQAVEKVQRRLAERKLDPLSFFAKPLNLPKRAKDKVGPTFQEEAMSRALEKVKSKGLSKTV